MQKGGDGDADGCITEQRKEEKKSKKERNEMQSVKVRESKSRTSQLLNSPAPRCAMCD